LLIPAPTVFAWWLIGLVSAAIVLSDVEAMLIPDRAVMAIGFGTSVVWRLKLSGVASAQLWPHGSLWPALAAALLLTLMFWFLWAMTRGRGMGLGDVKLVFPLALLVGWPGVVVMTLVAFISGALVGVGLLATQHANRKHTLPFAPFLFVGVVVTLWWGPEVLSWLKW
jgi:prepilin signal peptidase PulO-like enzyme (type II secretory pathway)